MSHPRVSDGELGWLAGIVDGEGSLNVGRASGRSKHLLTNPQITIASSDWRVIERMKILINRLTGMHVTAYNVAGCNNRDCWVVKLSRKPLLRAFLQPILRHLVLKKAQAAHIYEMANRCWDNRGMPEWVDRFGQKVRWFNQHRIGPDGRWYTAGYQRTRQSRAKWVSVYEPKRVETLQAAEPGSEEKVQEAE